MRVERDVFGEVVVLHRNVDLDAIISAYLYALKRGVDTSRPISPPRYVWLGDLVITTEEYFAEVVDLVLFLPKKVSKIVVLDMPMKDEIAKKAEELGVEIEHYDHHDGSAPSTARILWENFGDELPEWSKYLVELADYSDTGKVLRLPAPVKYFHLTGLINALRTYGYDDLVIMLKVIEILNTYIPMLQKLVEAEKLVKDIPVIEVGNYKTVSYTHLTLPTICSV